MTKKEDTGWFSNTPVEKELKRLTINQLFFLSKHHPGIKSLLISFLMTKDKLIIRP